MWNIKILFLLLFCSFARGQFVINSYAYASESAVFDGQNAADPVNEVNGTANTDGNGEMTITSQSSPTAQNGTYFLRLENDTNGSNDAYITLVGVTNGQAITVDYYVAQLNGQSWTTLLPASDFSVSDQQNPNDGVAPNWEALQMTGTASTDNPRLNIRTTGSGLDGHQIGVDNIVITIN